MIYCHDILNRFGLKAADQWRVETRNEDGAVKGQYYYRSPDGGEVNMSYNSGGGQQQDQRLRQSGALAVIGDAIC